MRKVIVKPYQQDWVRQFQQEAHILHKLFGGLVVDIHHIGSTAVPGLAAKPVIDLLPVVTNLEQVDAFNARMEALGYEQEERTDCPVDATFKKVATTGLIMSMSLKWGIRKSSVIWCFETVSVHIPRKHNNTVI